ncbi:MAG: hypothetical protein IKE22_13840 [Atopobiaceae bacterium]|nr:hypothetical protein [Atopobiaceae bacterium]
MSEPVYIVRFPGIHRFDDFDRMRERFMEVNGSVLGENVVFVDGAVADIFELEKQDVGRLVEVLAPAIGYEVRKIDEHGIPHIGESEG